MTDEAQRAAWRAKHNKTRARCFALAKECGGLTDEERRELAMMATWPPSDKPVSWARLTTRELERLADFLHGFVLLRHLYDNRNEQTDGSWRAKHNKTRARCFALAKECGGLTDEERRELAMMATWPPSDKPVSWARLTTRELERLADFLHGFVLLRHLYDNRNEQTDGS